MDLVARIEAITLKIIKQISIGQLPCISYSSSRKIATELSLCEENVCTRCSSSLRLNTVSNDSLFDFADKQDKKGEKNSSQNSKKITVDFKVKKSRNKFILMMMIMSEAHRLLLTNTTKTKRSFYYDLKNETTKNLMIKMPDQKSIDRVLNNVANLLECAPWDLSKFVKLYLLFNCGKLYKNSLNIQLKNIVNCLYKQFNNKYMRRQKEISNQKSFQDC